MTRTKYGVSTLVKFDIVCIDERESIKQVTSQYNSNYLVELILYHACLKWTLACS